MAAISNNPENSSSKPSDNDDGITWEHLENISTVATEDMTRPALDELHQSESHDDNRGLSGNRPQAYLSKNVADGELSNGTPSSEVPLQSLMTIIATPVISVTPPGPDDETGNTLEETPC